MVRRRRIDCPGSIRRAKCSSIESDGPSHAKNAKTAKAHPSGPTHLAFLASWREKFPGSNSRNRQATDDTDGTDSIRRPMGSVVAAPGGRGGSGPWIPGSNPYNPGSIRSEMLFDWKCEDRQGASERANPLGVLGVLA